MKTFKFVKPATEYVTVTNRNNFRYEFMVYEGKLICSDEDDPIAEVNKTDYDDWALSKEDSIALVTYLYEEIVKKKKK